LASGGFVVVWETNATLFPASAPDIRARVFDASGNALGPDLAVNTRTLGSQRLPEVVALSGGGFAVVWADLSASPAIRGQVFDAYGLRLGGEFSVHTSPAAADLGTGDLSVAELADGRLVVTWRGEDANGSGVLSQAIDPRDGVVEGGAGHDRLFGNDAWGDEISGFGGNDTLWGLQGGDILFGGQGNDTLHGGRGEDILYGNSGNDLLLGGAGGDDLFGGAGLDTASYATATGPVALSLDGSAPGGGEAAFDVLSGIELVLGSRWSDHMRGHQLGATMRGGEGGDTLEGLGGNDSLGGEAGADRIVGGTGTDSLSGGTGADDFVFLTLADSTADLNRDRILDFRPGEDDLVLTAIDARTGTAGDQAFVLDLDGSFSQGEIRQVVTAAGLLVEINNDADAAVDMAILLSGRTARLASTDFEL
jgi:Ca2+-binding RTX toxin-like protein